MLSEIVDSVVVLALVAYMGLVAMRFMISPQTFSLSFPLSGVVLRTSVIYDWRGFLQVPESHSHDT